jgi:hypothetical protein
MTSPEPTSFRQRRRRVAGAAATAAAALSLLLVPADGALAQGWGAGSGGGGRTYHAGGALAFAQPTGEFRDYVDFGFGIQGFFLAPIDESGIVSLRIDGGILSYGRETKRVCLSSTVGCRIQVDVTTSNNILLLGFGPEIGIPLGSARLYGSLTGGISYFSTDSEVRGSPNQDAFATTNNYGDAGFAWRGGAGIQIPLSRGETPVSLDFGVGFQGNGRREYLTSGDLSENPDGSLLLNVRRSDADFRLWTLGISVAIPPERGGGRGR